MHFSFYQYLQSGTDKNHQYKNLNFTKIRTMSNNVSEHYCGVLFSKSIILCSHRQSVPQNTINTHDTWSDTLSYKICIFRSFIGDAMMSTIRGICYFVLLQRTMTSTGNSPKIRLRNEFLIINACLQLTSTIRNMGIFKLIMPVMFHKDFFLLLCERAIVLWVWKLNHYSYNLICGFY